MDVLSALKMVAPTQLPSIDMAREMGASRVISTGDLEKTGLGESAQPLSIGQASGPFENMLSQFVGEVSARQSAGADAVHGLLSGKNVSLHQAMISMEEANLSFQMMVEVRNKILDSYQELMRMSV